MNNTCYIVFTLLFFAAAFGGAEEHLVVHEWGTFTSLQDERGKALTGINGDDEPVPAFVHRLAERLIYDTRPVLRLRKGVPVAHPHVTMRMETPVVYFHLPPGWREDLTLDVAVELRGGWLTEYFPDAEVTGPGVDGGTGVFGPLRRDTVSTLEWNGLRVGGDVAGPATDAHVWLAPRAVDAAGLTTPSGEQEHYLFYRGVVRRDAPLRVVEDKAADLLNLFVDPQAFRELGPLAIDAMWLVDIRGDGAVAFRTLPAWVAQAPDAATWTPATFAEHEYSAANLDVLRHAMHDALVADGLYADEAAAMLETWKLSYFESPGRRLFFLVPRVWTDFVVPLSIIPSAEMPGPIELQRVMVGRIELVSERHRELLRRLAAGFERRPHDEITMELGRFAQALLLNEQIERPAEALGRFLATNGIRFYQP